MSSHPQLATERRLLPAWDQCAIRVYIQLAFCFPFLENSNDSSSSHCQKSKAEAHIRASLERLSCQRPEFAARLYADEQGRVWLERRADDVIPFEVRYDNDKTRLGSDVHSQYNKLKEKGFPPGAFVHPDLAISGVLNPLAADGGDGTSSSPSDSKRPVIQIQMSFLDKGGMILWVNAHHSLIDGDSLRLFVQCFAAQTRGEEVECHGGVAPATLRHLEESGESNEEVGHGTNARQDFADLIRAFPEYADLPDRNGPNAVLPSLDWRTFQDEGHGVVEQRILVFRHEALRRLGQNIAWGASWRSFSKSGRPPSSYLSHAALTWAHITKARVKATENRGKLIDPQAPSRLNTAVDWRKRVLRGTLRGYLGNAVAIPFTQIPVGDVLDAACPSSNSKASINDKLSHLARCIQETIDSVDEEFVGVRTKAMTACIDDPRRFGLGVDTKDPACIGFNTWRFLSSDADWTIPGVRTTRPDAVRRVGAKLGGEKALILPMGADDDKVELLIWLQEDALELLLRDDGYMCWVDHVVG